MRLDFKALAVAVGAIWAMVVVGVGLIHLYWPGYGGAFLELVASLYPGYQPGGFGSVVVGGLYAVLDGAICGAIIAWIYNAVSRPPAPRPAL